MQSYEVIILPLAEQDITHNVDYIYIEKKAPNTAIRLLHGFKNKIESLCYMPEKHALDEDEELAQLGIHKCYYKNYKINIFYLIITT